MAVTQMNMDLQFPVSFVFLMLQKTASEYVALFAQGFTESHYLSVTWCGKITHWSHCSLYVTQNLRKGVLLPLCQLSSITTVYL